MEYLLLEYPKCSTCQKAKKWLDQEGISYTARHIVEEKPTAEELALWINKSGLPIKKFFNTSGMVYRELGLKDRLDQMTNEEKIQLLASDGMLVKRPLIIGESVVLPGFKADLWEKLK